MPADLVQTLLTKNILDKDIPACMISSRNFNCQLPSKPSYGQSLWRQNISAVTFHWDILYLNLRKRIPDNIYKNQSKVAEVKLGGDGSSQIILESGEIEEFDLIVFADGAQSMGRKLIAKESELAYSGYVAWRGTIDFDLITDQTPFVKNLPYYCFDYGHLLAYPVFQGALKKLNWVLYERLASEDLDGLGTTSVNDFSEKARVHLHQLARCKLPNAIEKIVIGTESPFMQKIVDACPMKLSTKGALLLGDAGIILRPHVGNGASLAIQDALSLSELLCSSDLQSAISKWEEDILPTRLSNFALSKRMAEALVLNPVLWQGMDESKMEEWWKKVQLGEKWYITDSAVNLTLQ